MKREVSDSAFTSSAGFLYSTTFCYVDDCSLDESLLNSEQLM